MKKTLVSLVSACLIGLNSYAEQNKLYTSLVNENVSEQSSGVKGVSTQEGLEIRVDASYKKGFFFDEREMKIGISPKERKEMRLEYVDVKGDGVNPDDYFTFEYDFNNTTNKSPEKLKLKVEYLEGDRLVIQTAIYRGEERISYNRIDTKEGWYSMPLVQMVVKTRVKNGVTKIGEIYGTLTDALVSDKEPSLPTKEIYTALEAAEKANTNSPQRKKALRVFDAISASLSKSFSKEKQIAKN